MSLIADSKELLEAVEAAPICRPSGLIRAAEAGQPGWLRAKNLPRLLRCHHLPEAEKVMQMLRKAEACAELSRLSGRADYDLHRHVRLLIAILSEMNLAQGNPSGL